MKIDPLSGSEYLISKCANVLFPTPDSPTTPIFSPEEIEQDMLLRIFISF